MIGKRCYSVECFNETVCEAVTAETTKTKPVIAYVARNAKAETQGRNGQIYTRMAQFILGQAFLLRLCINTENNYCKEQFLFLEKALRNQVSE